jgi:hypothetical protein
MKWSHAVCASILVDGRYSVPPVARPNPRSDQDFPGVPLNPASTPNALAADWGLSPETGRTPVLDIARHGIMRRRPSGFTSES